MDTVRAIWICLLSISLTNAASPTEVTLTITAEKRLLQVVWYNIELLKGCRFIITNQPSFDKSQTAEILAEVIPTSSNGWVTTNIAYDYTISRKANVTTDCYGYWVHFISATGQLKGVGCLRAYGTWMNRLRPEIEKFRMSDLLIPGTHDAGCYRVDFKPSRWETLFSKYSVTQDEDILGQLIHGARYLDIRPAYYKYLPNEQFYVNHGLIVQRPMWEVIAQVRDFVLKSKEFVIFGVKEFPFGFSNSEAHEKFVVYLEEKFRGMIVDPALKWNVTLGELWKRGQYVFLAYNMTSVVNRHSNIVFPPVDQRWGNVKTWEALDVYLKSLYKENKDPSEPVSDMAELTPDKSGVIFNKYGGLRRMADNVNSGVSNLYRNELGTMANIVAVDFLRGSTIADLAVKINRNKINKSYIVEFMHNSESKD